MRRQQKSQLERRALKVSLGGALFMALLGFSYAFYTHSEAILLDGVYSLVGLLLDLLTLRVAVLIERPEDEHFQFGYAQFEPLLNLFKGLMFLGICVLATISALKTLLAGGRQILIEDALVYSILATIGCVITAAYTRRVAKRSKSDLVGVSAKGWILDSAFSSAVLLAFVVGFLIQDSGFASYLPYLDPILVLILVALALPVPIGVLRDSLREVVLMAPSAELQQAIHDKLHQVIQDLAFDDYKVRVVKVGRSIYANIYLLAGERQEQATLIELDAARDKIYRSMSAINDQLILDVVITANRNWVEGPETATVG